jgi:Fe-S cluster assembly ATP-binding protein
MLKIKNLNIKSADHEILKDVNLEVKPGEVHAILGPTGSGKSGLVMALAGLPFVDVDSGSITFKSKSLLKQSIQQRSLNGLVSVFQHPVEIPNTTNWNLFCNILKLRNDKRDPQDLKKLYNETAESLGLDKNHGDTPADSDGMDHSEAIRNELLISFLLDPNLLIVDDIDEKLGAEDKLIVALNIKNFIHNKRRAGIILSKDKQVLEFIEPTHVHIMAKGQLALSGNIDILKRIEEDGHPELSTS